MRTQAFWRLGVGLYAGSILLILILLLVANVMDWGLAENAEAPFWLTAISLFLTAGFGLGAIMMACCAIRYCHRVALFLRPPRSYLYLILAWFMPGLGSWILSRIVGVEEFLSNVQECQQIETK